MVDGSSLLLDLDGVVVESMQRLGDGTGLVQVRTAPEWVGICPTAVVEAKVVVPQHGLRTQGVH